VPLKRRVVRQLKFMIKFFFTFLFCSISLNSFAQNDFMPLTKKDFDLKGKVKSATIQQHWQKDSLNFNEDGYLIDQTNTTQMSDDGFSSTEQSYFFYSENRIDSVVNYNFSGEDKKKSSIALNKYDSENRISLYEMFFLKPERELFIREEYLYKNGNLSSVNKVSYPGEEFKSTEYYYYSPDSLMEFEKIDSTWKDITIVVHPSENMRFVEYKDKNSITRLTIVSQEERILGENWVNSSGLIKRIFFIDDYHGCWGEGFFRYDENQFPESTVFKCHNSYESYKNDNGNVVQEEKYEYEFDDFGNWIKKATLEKTESGEYKYKENGTVERSITYF
jgi:hypothetical protein